MGYFKKDDPNTYLATNTLCIKTIKLIQNRSYNWHNMPDGKITIQSAQFHDMMDALASATHRFDELQAEIKELKKKKKK